VASRSLFETTTRGIATAWRALVRGLTSSASRLALVVFLALILVFTALFSLPIASVDGTVTPLVDALFTAVATICVTGLSTLDMATHWSPFGQVLVFIGVNVGGMGALTLASILGMIISRRLGLKAKLLAAGDNNPLRAHAGPVNERQSVRLGEVGQLLATVAISTIVIELVVTALLYPSFIVAGVDPVTALWEAPYYAAMSFTNTGFTPNVEGVKIFADDYFILLVLMGSVFLGSIGFPVIYTLSKHVWHVRKWSLHTKLTLLTTVLLFFAGGLTYLMLEGANSRTFGEMDPIEATMNAFFLSAMTRSGGFSLIDINDLNGSSMLVTGMLMFVGGGSASTAGGIKVTTFAVLAIAVWSEARGRDSVQAFGRRIPSDVVRVSLSVVAWAATIIALSTITIIQITNAPLESVLIEVISGFGTVGLSTGLSAELPDSAAVVLAAAIFMGRVGTVTLAAAIAATSRPQQFTLPEERPIVG
jgi:trk system potassium uptake protein TrkH